MQFRYKYTTPPAYISYLDMEKKELRHQAIRHGSPALKQFRQGPKAFGAGSSFFCHDSIKKTAS